MMAIKILLFIFGFAELGIVTYFSLRYKKVDIASAFGIMAIVAVNLACAVVYFAVGIWLI